MHNLLKGTTTYTTIYMNEDLKKPYSEISKNIDKYNLYAKMLEETSVLLEFKKIKDVKKAEILGISSEDNKVLRRYAKCLDLVKSLKEVLLEDTNYIKLKSEGSITIREDTVFDKEFFIRSKAEELIEKTRKEVTVKESEDNKVSDFINEIRRILSYNREEYIAHISYLLNGIRDEYSLLQDQTYLSRFLDIIRTIINNCGDNADDLRRLDRIDCELIDVDRLTRLAYIIEANMDKLSEDDVRAIIGCTGNKEDGLDNPNDSKEEPTQ